MIPKKREATLEIRSFSCLNPACGRTFANPLRAMVIGSKDPRTYVACPYCLTEICANEIAETPEEEPRSDEETIRPNNRTTPQANEGSDQPSEKPEGCMRHFGYLSQRSSKEKIPDECMVCENIVKCMLKAIKN